MGAPRVFIIPLLVACSLGGSLTLAGCSLGPSPDSTGHAQQQSATEQEPATEGDTDASDPAVAGPLTTWPDAVPRPEGDEVGPVSIGPALSTGITVADLDVATGHVQKLIDLGFEVLSDQSAATDEGSFEIWTLSNGTYVVTYQASQLVDGSATVQMGVRAAK
jgi:hypothetical protein